MSTINILSKQVPAFVNTLNFKLLQILYFRQDEISYLTIAFCIKIELDGY